MITADRCPPAPFAVYRTYLGIGVFLACMWPPHVALAQKGGQEVDAPPLILAHRVDAVIDIDGRMDEPVWQASEAAFEFLQSEPSEGSPASQRTEVRVLYGTDHVYFGAMLYDEDPSRIEPTLGRRDEMNRADWFIVSIDAYYDQRTAYVFGVSAAGVQLDALQTGRGGPGGGLDESWNAIWASSARLHAAGWAVEMRIPYSMLRFARAEEQTWGIHFERHIPTRGEVDQWPLILRSERSNRVAQYGVLKGLIGIKPHRNVQIRPYTVSRMIREENEDVPGTIATQRNVDVGGDLKIGLGSNVTLDATINPDFGQVESDPAELNLTAFETFFPEQRPFFIEGTEIYEFSLGRGSDLLYTRRIGGENPIIGAAKLSGRTANGLSFGFLGATTGNRFDPNREFLVTRLNKQFPSLSTLGGVITGFEGPGDDGGRIRSLTGGADWDFRFNNNSYGLSGFSSFTHRNWTLEDTPSETGFAASLRGAKRRGSTRYDATVNVFDNQYNPNDLGRLRRNNYINLDVGFDIDLNEGKPLGPFQRAFVGYNVGQRWSYDEGLNLGTDLRLFSFNTLKGFQRTFIRAGLNQPFGGYDLFETRGLGPRAQPVSFDFFGDFTTDERRPWQLEPGISFSFADDGGRGYGFDLEANWNIGSRLSLTGDLGFEWEDDVIAWSSNETFLQRDGVWMIGEESASPEDLAHFVPINNNALLNDVTADRMPYDEDGHHYLPIFGARDTRAIDLTLRSSITFTNRLSLLFYGQLFAARGKYEQFQILQDRDTLVPFSDFPKRDEFTFSNFQANTVLRWEYRPGSVLYLVWTQGRSADVALNPLAPWGNSPYDVALNDQISDTFRIIPNNVFLIKFDYAFLR